VTPRIGASVWRLALHLPPSRAVLVLIGNCTMARTPPCGPLTISAGIYEPTGIKIRHSNAAASPLRAGLCA